MINYIFKKYPISFRKVSRKSNSAFQNFLYSEMTMSGGFHIKGISCILYKKMTQIATPEAGSILTACSTLIT